MRSTCQRVFGLRVVTFRGVTWGDGQGPGGRVSRNILGNGGHEEDAGSLDERPVACSSQLKDRRSLRGWIMGPLLGFDLLQGERATPTTGSLPETARDERARERVTL